MALSFYGVHSTIVGEVAESGEGPECRICEVGSEGKVIDLQIQSWWKDQSFWEHGGLPTGTCAHVPMNTFISEAVECKLRHYAPYYLIL